MSNNAMEPERRGGVTQNGEGRWLFPSECSEAYSEKGVLIFNVEGAQSQPREAT